MGYVQTSNLYASTSNLWQMALPPDTLFCDGSLLPGIWTTPVLTGTSTGSVKIDPASNPHDDLVCILKCISSGELNQDGVINPGNPPVFQLSLDSGVTFSFPLYPQSFVSKDVANGTNLLSYVFSGIRFFLLNGNAPVSFVANDTWNFTTSASPDIISALSRASRFVENYLQDTYQLPYTAWGDDLRGVVCEMARWYLIKRRGLHQRQDMQAYAPVEAMDWLKNVAEGNIQPAIIEKNGTYLFPSVVCARRRYEMDWRT